MFVTLDSVLFKIHNKCNHFFFFFLITEISFSCKQQLCYQCREDLLFKDVMLNNPPLRSEVQLVISIFTSSEMFEVQGIFEETISEGLYLTAVTVIEI